MVTSILLATLVVQVEQSGQYVCVCACELVIIDLNVWHARSPWSGLGNIRRPRTQVNVHVHRRKLEMWPMPNVMVALPNIGGALYSTPQSLADTHY